MMLEIQVLTWDRHKNVACLNWLMGSEPSPLMIKFTSLLLMVGGSLRVLQLLPPLKLVAMI